MKKFITPIKTVVLLAVLSAGLYPGTAAHAQSKKKKTSTHTSKNSLDWAGAYSNGLIQLSLFEDNSYLYQNGNLFNSGKVTWAPGGNLITLSETKEKYRVMEGKLKNEFNGNEFVKSGVVTETPTAGVVKINKHLLGGKWVLTELHGKPIVKSEQLQKVPFLAFKEEDGTFFGHSGCNGFGGSVKQMNDFKIEFGPAIQTMMACIGIMDIENQFSEVLRTADNYTVKNGVLSLNKAKMAPLAKFKFVATK